MKAYSKLLLGAFTIVTMSIVACGKSRGNNSGGGGGNGGFGCVQVGATCIQTAPGFVGQGTWTSDRRDNATFKVADVTVTLNSNQGAGGGAFGGGFGGGYYGGQYGGGQYGGQQAPVQTTASVVIRYANGTIRGQGIANGGSQGFSVTLLSRNGQPLIVNGQQVTLNGQFMDQSQTVMNFQIVGALPAQGQIIRRGGGGAPIGYGSGGYGFGGSYGEDQLPYGYGSTGITPDQEYQAGFLGIRLPW